MGIKKLIHNKTIKKNKVFCIGRNKTGTTSIGRALSDLGYQLADQNITEGFVEDWAIRDFSKLIKYCSKADAFQDVPFSLEFTFQVMDQFFPGSKFILTIRDSPYVWFKSLTKFHSKLIGNGQLPTVVDLNSFEYRSKGWVWRMHQLIYGVGEKNLYDEKIYTNHYIRHNEQVKEYFKYKKSDLLILNLKDDDAMKQLCDFLDIEYCGQTMPCLNVSSGR